MMQCDKLINNCLECKLLHVKASDMETKQHSLFAKNKLTNSQLANAKKLNSNLNLNLNIRHNLLLNSSQLISASSKVLLDNKFLRQTELTLKISVEARTGLSNPKLTQNKILLQDDAKLHTLHHFPSKIELKNKFLQKKYKQQINALNSLINKKAKDVIKLEDVKREVIFDNFAQLLEENVVEVPRYAFILSSQKKLVILNEFSKNDFNVLRDPKTQIKIGFINAVSSSLIAGPNMKKKSNVVRKIILKHATETAKIDPEFVLKVAAYTRRELNIRATANLLLAFAASTVECRPYVGKYFNCAVCLPSDWIDVAEQCQLFLEEGKKARSLPAVLRTAMKSKFPEFDEYQLAKYNKVKSVKKKDTKIRQNKGLGPRTYAEKVAAKKQDETDLKVAFSLKKLIGLLHLSKPANHVMGILGKKYPKSLAEFWSSGLVGTWEEERSGKRMKLAVPETWETQLCLFRNRAKTWEKLIDDKKLPFMAMLRNLRNLIVTNISDKYHEKIIRILTNEDSVIRSKQFPFRFLSAYNVMSTVQTKVGERSKYNMRGYKKPEKMEGWLWKTRKMKDNKIKPLIERYKVALNKAIDISTVHNIPPIKGNSIILCDSNSSSMDGECPTAKGLQRSVTIREIAALLAVMCKHVCESSELHVCGEESEMVQIEKNQSILDTVKYLLYDNTNPGKFPAEIFERILTERVQVDTLIIFSTSNWDKTRTEIFVKNYRILHNPNLLYVFVDLSSKFTNTGGTKETGHPNNILLSGFSDQLLRFIAERGSSKQLQHINQIAVKYKLKSSGQISGAETVDFVATPNVRVPKWKTLRVFVSSTFRDMHGERDLLLRSVFPQVRARALELYVDVHDVDLRWGITEQEAEDNKMLEICLSEAAQCDIFLGLLGSRYGTIVREEHIPEAESFDWVRNYRKESSVTELEFQVGVLGRNEFPQSRAIVCIRDDYFVKDVPEDYLKDFTPESAEHKFRLEQLKSRVRASKVQLIDNYSCEWGGVIGALPAVSGLDELEKALIERLWGGLKLLHSSNESDSAENIHERFAAHQSKSFTGRNDVLKQCLNAINGKNNLIVVDGKSGSGKTCFLSALCIELTKDPKLVVIPYFSDAVSGEKNVDWIVSYFYDKLCNNLKIETTGSSIVIAIHEILSSALQHNKHFVLLLDGTDNFAWIPNPVPANVKFICTISNSEAAKSMMEREMLHVKLLPLDFKQRAQFVRDILLPYRKKLSDSAFDNQLSKLVSKYEANSPLFLTLACHQMRLFWVHENISENLASMPGSTSGLLKEIILQIERYHDSTLVATAFKLMAMSSEGLTEDDLYGILNLWICSHKSIDADLSEMCRFAKLKALSRSYFARFYRSINVFLNLSSFESDNVLRIANKEIISVISSYCQNVKYDSNLLDKCIAVYYLQQIDPTEEESYLGKNPKAFQLIISRLLTCGHLEKALQVATDLKFLFAKSNAGLCSSIFEDFVLIQREIGENCRIDRADYWKCKVNDYQSFVNRHHRALSEMPTRIFQLAVNERDASIVCQDGKCCLKSIDVPPMIEWLNKPEEEESYTGAWTVPEAVTCISTIGDIAAIGMSNGVVRFVNLITSKVIRNITAAISEVTCVCFVGADQLVCASEFGLTLWDVESGNCVTTFEGHQRKVTACVCSGGKRIISVSWDRTIRIWDVKSGKKVSILKENNPINCCVMHPVRNVIATGVWDGSVRIWDLVKNKRIALLHGHDSSVTSISLSPCGKHLASSSLGGEIIIRSSRYGFQLAKFRASSLRINKVLHTGNELWTISDDFSVKVWSSLLSDSRDVTFSLAHSSKVLHIAISPFDIDSIVIAFEDSTIVKLNRKTGNVIFRVSPVDRVSRVTCVYFDESLYVAYSNGVQVLDPITGERLRMLEHTESAITAIATVCHSSNRTQSVLMFGCADGTLCVEENGSIVRVKAHDDLITRLVSQPSSKALCASVSRDKSLKVWKNGKELFTKAENCHKDWITQCAWGPDDPHPMLVTASNDNAIKLWKLTSFLTKMRELGTTSGPPIFLDVWENCVVCGSSDGNVKVLTLKSSEVMSVNGEETTQFVSCFGRKARGAYNWYEEVIKEESGEVEIKDEKSWPVGSLMAVCNGSLKCIKLFGDNKVKTLSGHSSFVQALCETPNEKILTGSADKTVMMWKRQISASLVEENKSEISSISWSDDENFMITGCRDGLISLWMHKRSVEKYIIISRFNVKSQSVISVHFVRKDKFVVTTLDGLVFTCKIDENFVMSVAEREKSEIPILCSAYCKENDIFAIANIHGQINLYDVETGKLNRSLPVNLSNWVIQMKFLNNTLFILDGSGEVTTYSLKNENLTNGAFKCETLISSDVIPQCLYLQENYCFVGLSNGVLARIHALDKTIETIPLHTGGIKFCAVDHKERLLVTASNDCTVKVWSLEEDFNIKQPMAQFECSAPVCSLSLCSTDGIITCADFHGKVYFLRLRYKN